MSRLQKIYRQAIIPKMKKDFGFKNNYQVPNIKSVIVHSGIGKAVEDPAYLEQIARDLAKITGQKPAITKARSAIAGFKLRKNAKIGAKVTLRGKRMYDFLDRLINISLPSIRDFQGIKTNSFDKNGNLNIGIAEHQVFPETSLEQKEKPFGLQITFVTNASNKKVAKSLLEGYGMVFSKK